MKKYILVVLSIIIPWMSVFAKEPKVECKGLPGCIEGDGLTSGTIVINVFSKVVAEGIKYVAVVAVICLMLAGIKYMTSGGEEEKVNKAKMWIIYSLVGVLLSVAAWSIVNIINEFSI